METITYKTQGTCSKAIEIAVNGDTIESVKFLGGCPGNTQGVAALCRGMKVDEAIEAEGHKMRLQADVMSGSAGARP